MYLPVGSTFYESDESHRTAGKSSMMKREYTNKSWSRSERRLTDISDSDAQGDPDSDITPKLRMKAPSLPDVRSSPSSDTTRRKKIYQKTRFSAEIPMIKRAKPTNATNVPVRLERKSSSLGDTFRKIIGKFQGNSNSDESNVERKRKTRGGDSPVSGNSRSGGDVSYSAKNENHYDGYQPFNSVDSGVVNADTRDQRADTVGSGREQRPLQKKQPAKYRSLHEEPQYSAEAAATTSTSSMKKKRVTTESNARRPPIPFLPNGTFHTLDRNHRVQKHPEQNGDDSKQGWPPQKYYLGEDPNAGSIYGKEKGYDSAAAKPGRSKLKNGNSTDDEKKSVKSQLLNGVHNILGGKLIKSNNKLLPDNNQQRVRRINIDYTDRGVQTLPKKSKKQVFINDPHSDQENLHSRRSYTPHRTSDNMINVSMMNNRSPVSSFKQNGFAGNELQGPRKPARTYHSSLLRSHSFNVPLGPTYERNSTFKSNPQLHKLDESPPPLKSPNLVTSINRSTRDLSESFDEHYFSHDTSKRTFLSDLKSRTPQLYKTLHEDDEVDFSVSGSRLHSGTTFRNKHKMLDYSNSFENGGTVRKPAVSFESDRYLPQSGNAYTEMNGKNGVHRTVSKTGSNDDYSETIRLTSKSKDPLRPSVTNTVQSFSKKTVPSKDGRLETIESSETTKVTKSHFRDRPISRNRGIIIDFRNERK